MERVTRPEGRRHTGIRPGTDAERDLASFVAIRCSKPGVMVVSDTSSVFLLSSLFRIMVLVAVTTVLHGPVADSLRTSSGPQPDDCRPLVDSMGVWIPQKVESGACLSRKAKPSLVKIPQPHIIKNKTFHTMFAIASNNALNLTHVMKSGKTLDKLWFLLLFLKDES